MVYNTKATTADQFITELSSKSMKELFRFEDIEAAWDKVKETLPVNEQAAADAKVVKAIEDKRDSAGTALDISAAKNLDDYLTIAAKTGNYSMVSWEIFKRTLPLVEQADAERRMRESFGRFYIQVRA